MSERATWKVSTAYVTIFKVVDSSDAAVTGLVNGNFTKKLTKDAVNSAVVVTVTEVDATNEAGWYKASYTPNANGLWTLVVTHATYNAVGWQDDVDVYSSDPNAVTVDASGRVDVGSISGQAASAAAPVTFPASIGTSTYSGGAVASVTGDVSGKVLGGGSGTISGVGVQASVSAISAGTITSGSFAAGAIDAAAIAANAIGASELAADAANKIADHVLRRTLANVRASSNGDAVVFRSALGALAKLVNKIAMDAGGTTLSVYDETDAGTPVGTQTVTSSSSANPVTGLDTD